MADHDRAITEKQAALSDSRRTYEECLAAYFPALLTALGGHPEQLGSWDRVHERFVR